MSFGNGPRLGTYYRGAARKSLFGPYQTGWKYAEFFVYTPDGIRPDFSDVRNKFGQRVTGSILSEITTGGCANGSLFVFYPIGDGTFRPVCTACPVSNSGQVVVQSSDEMIGDVRRIVVSDGPQVPVDARLCMVAGLREPVQNCPLQSPRWKYSPGECQIAGVSQQVQRQKYWGYGI